MRCFENSIKWTLLLRINGGRPLCFCRICLSSSHWCLEWYFLVRFTHTIYLLEISCNIWLPYISPPWTWEEHAARFSPRPSELSTKQRYRGNSLKMTLNCSPYKWRHLILKKFQRQLNIWFTVWSQEPMFLFPEQIKLSNHQLSHWNFKLRSDTLSVFLPAFSSLARSSSSFGFAVSTTVPYGKFSRILIYVYL